MASIAKKTSNFVVWILLGLLFVSLAGFGITSFSGGSSQVAQVGRAEVTAEAYFRELRTVINQRVAQTGEPVRFAQLQADRVPEAVRGALIARASLENEALEMGLSVSDASVFEQLSAIPAFQGSDGFNRALYLATLADEGLSPADFEEQIRADTARTLLQVAVTGGVEAPDALTEALVAREVETRDFTVVRISPEALQAETREPDAAELQAFYDENAARFTRPETRAISYAWVTPDMLLDEVEVDEALLRQEYEARSAEFNRPERRLVERLVFPSQSEAEAAAAALEAEETSFDELVAGRGLSLEDIDLGDVSRDELTDAAAQAVFAEDAAEIVGPVDSRFGPALFRINAVLNATEVTFDEARPDIEAELALIEARAVIAEEREPVDDLLAGGAVLEELEAESLMRFAEITYGAEDEDDVIAGYDAFRAAAEAAEIGDFPELIGLSDGGLVALRLDAINPPFVPPLDEIENEVTAAWRDIESDRALEAAAQDLMTGIVTDGLSLDAASEEAGYEVLSLTEQNRREFLPELPPTLIGTVFDLESAGDMAVVPASGQAVLVRLDEIRAGNVNDPDVAALIEIVGQQAGQSLAEDLFQSFGQAMEGEVGIRINQAVINQIHSQFR